MINSVRQSVLSVLNKNNYGYLSPADFNLFAKQAQLDIFESYFYQYNYQINKENARQSGTGIADLAKGIEESMDLFSVTRGLNLDTTAAGQYLMPSAATTGSDYYLVNKLLVYKDIVTSGQGTAPPGATTIFGDTTATFISDGVIPGDIIALETSTQGVQYRTIATVPTEVDLTVSSSFESASPLAYSIFRANTQQNEAEKVTHSKITMLNNSIYTAPTLEYPAYTSEETSVQVFPSTNMTAGRVVAQYFRYPRDPNWTYVTLAGGEPVFNQTAGDFQDFELPLDEENNLTMKILQYAGVTIREPEVFGFAAGEETKEQQKEG